MRKTILLLAAVLLMSGCTPISEFIIPPKPTFIPTYTPLPEATATPTETPTPPPSATALPSPTPTETATPNPTATPTIEPCLSEGGQMEQELLYTEVDRLPWEFRVYTPACYREHPEQRYPLLILIHGSTFNDDQWDRLGADETADNLIATGQAPPFLILMPRDRVWTEPDSDPFGRALMEDILPWMSENYQVAPGRENLAIGGLSRGASWAVHLGLKHWQTFGSIGAHSLPTFATDPYWLQVWVQSIPFEGLPRIYMDIGEKDYLLDKAIWFENMLTENNVPHEWHLYTGSHEEAYWASHVEEYLLWYTAAWQRQ